ncbi:cytochrome B [Sulfurifustis variabilis]|uniref:Cytochrome B n=1 Tax=Sulfurifustis variabilis TaxID=1675686 RepID=A0A1B4V7H7_9GAMM|nr:cytochrome b/b6 domain-containing protein [Sulfurifustis variabilis]BAU49486.1 cytochrome B [Sulfurifustis variabilis]
MTSARTDDAVLVWDVPTRMFHWLFAIAFAAAWFTRDSSRWLDVHVFAGYAFAGLLVFRLLWGIVGGRYARFRAFAWPFREARAYLIDILRGRARRHLGHNPAGSWAIYGLLLLGLGVAATGIGTLGGEERHGPLAGLLDFRAGDLLHGAHEVAAVAMLVLVFMHLAGVLVESAVHRENLVAAMLNGRKRGTAPPARAYRPIGIAVAAAVLLGGTVSFSGYLWATPERPYLPFTGPSLPDDAVWRSECGACHLAYHPVLLPARSWERLMAGQADHFGDDLALDPETAAGIAAFLRAYAAESALTEAAWKIGRTTPATQAPLRITDTRYWRRRHRDIPDAAFETAPVNGRHDCAACHLDAEQGTFEDGAMRLPALRASSPGNQPQKESTP